METPAGGVDTVAGEVQAEAERVASQPDFPAAYVDRVRVAAARLGVAEDASDDVRNVVLLLEQQADIDANIPVSARTLPFRLVKQVVRKLIGWYVRVLVDQVRLLGQATSRLGLTVAQRLDRIETEQQAEHTALKAEIARLQARVAELEANS
jgi:hypothetical protein